MRYSENLQEKREREVEKKTKRCACGLRTYEKDSVCAVCKAFNKNVGAGLVPAPTHI